MRSKHIRLIVTFAFLACIGIIATQIYWVNSAWELHEREFTYKVRSAMGEAANKIMEYQGVQAHNYNPVEIIQQDYYLVVTNVFVEEEVLKHYILEAFNKYEVNTNFQMVLYDCTNDQPLYQSYVKLPSAKLSKDPQVFDFPKVKRENYYFGVKFPHYKKMLLAQNSYWLASSLVLLGILVLLGYLLIIIFKQKRLSEIQKDFVSNMTHEFKTPLASIQLSSEVLKNPTIINNPQRLLNYATLIAKEAKHLTAVVERVLHMSRANKKELEIKKEPFVWQELINEVVGSFTDILIEKNATIDLDLPKEPINYLGDTLHLKNVISNLIDNGLKYNDKDPQITIRLNTVNRKILLSFKDNGIGIPKQYHKLLFTNFFRVPTGNIHNVKGFGLGLGYVKTIVKAHEGFVSCSSKEHEGSTFTLEFPIIK